MIDPVVINEWLMFEVMPERVIGFTYMIVNNITMQMYIGMKSLNGKWQDYVGSSKYLKNDINKYGLENFTKGVIRFHYDTESLAQHEVNLQMHLDVLRSKFLDGTPMFYNKRILGVGWNTLGIPAGKGTPKPGVSAAQTGRPGFWKGKKNTKQIEKVLGTKNPKSSATKRLKGPSPEQIAHNQNQKGKPKPKNSVALKGKPWSAERRKAHEDKKAGI
jgi:hypothetical protein